MLIKKLVDFIWQLPQAWLYFALRPLLQAQPAAAFRGIPVAVFRSPTISSFGLGVAILLNANNPDPQVLPHEFGHCRQSRMLGWAYLPVVGLPSLVCNLLSRVSPKIRAGYYQRFPENWADQLGGVIR